MASATRTSCRCYLFGRFNGRPCFRKEERAVLAQEEIPSVAAEYNVCCESHRTDRSAWEEQTSSPTEDTKLVVLPRPNGKDSRVAVPAEETRRAREQTRRRIRVLSDGASVLEEQTVTFAERIVVWEPGSTSDPDPPV